MSTRGLVAIQMDGEYKLASYNHSDSYPRCLGVELLKFLRELKDDRKLEMFKENLNKVKKISSDEADKLEQDCAKVGKSPYDIYPGLLLSVPEILELIRDMDDETDGELIVCDDLSFAADGLFCEWTYVIDFDENTFEVFKGGEKTPLEEFERFYDVEQKRLAVNPDNMGYYGVKFLTSWHLDELPNEDEFLSRIDALTFFTPELTQLLKNAEFTVMTSDGTIEFFKRSPAGRDFSFCVNDVHSLPELSLGIYQAYENFDVSEETYLWLDDTGHGKRGAPYELEDVLEDVKACEQIILEANHIVNDYFKT